MFWSLIDDLRLFGRLDESNICRKKQCPIDQHTSQHGQCYIVDSGLHPVLSAGHNESFPCIDTHLLVTSDLPCTVVYMEIVHLPARDLSDMFVATLEDVCCIIIVMS